MPIDGCMLTETVTLLFLRMVLLPLIKGLHFGFGCQIFCFPSHCQHGGFNLENHYNSNIVDFLQWHSSLLFHRLPVENQNTCIYILTFHTKSKTQVTIGLVHLWFQVTIILEFQGKDLKTLLMSIALFYMTRRR